MLEEEFSKHLNAYEVSDSRSRSANITHELHVFITSGAGCGKSHLITTIHASVSENLNYIPPTGAAAIKFNGNTDKFRLTYHS